MTEIEDTLTAAAKVNPLIGLAGQRNIAETWYSTTPDRSDGLNLGSSQQNIRTYLSRAG